VLAAGATVSIRVSSLTGEVTVAVPAVTVCATTLQAVSVNRAFNQCGVAAVYGTPVDLSVDVDVEILRYEEQNAVALLWTFSAVTTCVTILQNDAAA